MHLNFSKYHGCGNDFICTDFRTKSYDLIFLAKTLCRRHFSIGADGLIALYNSDQADFKMVIANADGSIPEMCGNGLRCFVHFLSDLNLLINDRISIETDAGILTVTVINHQNNLLETKVEIGKAKFLESLPSDDFNFNFKETLYHDINVDGTQLRFIPISMGNPHAVVFVDHLDSINISKLGRSLEKSDLFPNNVNVEFVEVRSESLIKMSVWERGVGETNACGTGACASAVAAYLTNQCKSSVTVQLAGGDLVIDFDSVSHNVIMQGPSEFVYNSNIQV